MEQIGDIRWKAFYRNKETHLCRMRLEYISPKRKSFHYRYVDGPLEGELRKYSVHDQPFETGESALYDHQRRTVMRVSDYFISHKDGLTTAECVAMIVEAEDMKRRLANTSGERFFEQTQSILVNPRET